jgi:hypothetical protein
MCHAVPAPCQPPCVRMTGKHAADNEKTRSCGGQRTPGCAPLLHDTVPSEVLVHRLVFSLVKCGVASQHSGEFS